MSYYKHLPLLWKGWDWELFPALPLLELGRELIIIPFSPLLYMSLHNPCYVHLSTPYISYVIYCSLFLFNCGAKRKSEPKKKKHAKDFCAACGIALTEWTYVLFALLTKSFRFCYCAYAHAKLQSVTHVSESGERARSAIVSLERI